MRKTWPDPLSQMDHRKAEDADMASCVQHSCLQRAF